MFKLNKAVGQAEELIAIFEVQGSAENNFSANPTPPR